MVAKHQNVDEKPKLTPPKKRGRPPGKQTEKVGFADEPTGSPTATTTADIGELRERAVHRLVAAAIVDVTIQSLNAWVDNGQIRVTREGFIPVAEVRRKAIEVYEKKRSQMMPADAVESETTVASKVRLERAKADLAELEFRNKLAGVVSARAVEARYLDMAAMVRARMMTLPDRLADALAAERDRHKVREAIAVAVHQALTMLAAPYKMKTDDKEHGDGAAEEAG